MISIYSTQEIISSIYHNDERRYSAWLELIIKLRPNLKLWFDTEINNFNEYNPVIDLSKSFDIGIEIIGEYSEFINKIANKDVNLNNVVLIDAQAIYLLDIDKKTAKFISDRYGIICHSIKDDPIECPLFQEGIEKNYDKGEYQKEWKDILINKVTYPCNSLIFNDRYLFAFETSDKNNEIAIDNVYDILNNILPENLSTEFHILIIFDASKLTKPINEDNNIEKFKKISTKINSLKKKLNRPYPIVIETVSLDSNTLNYQETHNRRVLSNYFILRAEHSLKAFQSKKVLYTQSLLLDWIASKGILTQVNSDIPAKSLKTYIKNLSKSIQQLKKDQGNILFTQNGNPKISIKEIRNRLIELYANE